MTRAPKGKEIPREELQALLAAAGPGIGNWSTLNPQPMDWQSQPKRATQAGLTHCAEREAVFHREQVERFALENHLGQQCFDEVQQTLDHRSRGDSLPMTSG